MGKRPTSKDVAEKAGVSRTTVSYVLNKKEGSGIRISEATREKIWDAVRELDYRPSRAAVALRTNRTHLLALMIPHIETPYHPLIASAIQREAERVGLGLMVFSTRDDRERELEFVDSLLGRRADGLVLQSYQLRGEDLEALVAESIAVVVFGSSPTHELVDNIVFDESRAAEAVVGHLAAKGHRRIATISGPGRTWCGSERLAGYHSGLQGAGLPADPELICEADFYDAESAGRCMERLLSLPEPPTAVFAANDLLAFNAMLYAQDRGYSVPGDLAFVGFDDTPLALMARPRLTTVRKSRSKQAVAAVELLDERIRAKRPLPAREVILPYELVVRDST